MKAREALIAWTPQSWPSEKCYAGQVMIGPLLRDSDGDWTAPCAYTGGAAYTKTRALRRDASALMLFIDFVDMVVRDGIDPLVAHRAFMAADEYREGVAEDTAAIGVNGQGRPRTGRGRACDWLSPTASTSSSPRPRASAPQSAW